MWRFLASSGQLVKEYYKEAWPEILKQVHINLTVQGIIESYKAFTSPSDKTTSDNLQASIKELSEKVESLKKLCQDNKDMRSDLAKFIDMRLRIMKVI